MIEQKIPTLNEKHLEKSQIGIHGFDDITDDGLPKDVESFNKSTGGLVDEYNRFEVLPGLHVNGNLTLQENIADFGGLTIAYHAYMLSLKGKPEMIDRFTGDQRLF